MLEEKLPSKGEEEQKVTNPIGDAKKALQKAKYAIVEAVVEETKSGIESLKKMRKSAKLEGIELKEVSASSLLGLESKIEVSKDDLEYERLKGLVKSAQGEKEPPKEEPPKEGGKV
jgi:hypothetical protein